MHLQGPNLALNNLIQNMYWVEHVTVENNQKIVNNNNNLHRKNIEKQLLKNKQTLKS